MNTLFDVKDQPGTPSTAVYDVVVVGAGPYGLSVAAHLMNAGLKVAIFGKPLSFWSEHMPVGMLLRSAWWATHLSDPQKLYTLERYFKEIGQEPSHTFPIETFIDYGLWFQQQVVPDVDETYVELIEKKERHFVLTLSDERVIQSRAVIMAPGLRYYIHRPDEYSHLPAELVSHSSDFHTFEQFVGKRLVIVGGGQGALENAALAHESGAQVELISRQPLIWIQPGPKHPSLMYRLRYPSSGIQPGWYSRLLEEFPYAFQHLPRKVKDSHLSGAGSYGPKGDTPLKPRVLGKVAVHEAQQVQDVKETDGGVELLLSNNERVRADHVMLGTGYRVDIKRLPMLHPSLLSQIRTYQNAPILSDRFESSVPGMYFVGFSSVSSCGPLYRFVVGTPAAARRVAPAVAKQVARVR